MNLSYHTGFKEIVNFHTAANTNNPFVVSRRFSSMNFIFILTAIVYLALPLSGFAQETTGMHKENSLQFNVGINQIKEENLHSKVHQGALFDLSYGHNKYNNNLSQLEVYIQYSRLKTRVEDLMPSINIQISAQYNFLFKGIKNEKFCYYVGPGITLHYGLVYYPNWDESHLYWGDYLSSNLVNKLMYQLNEENSIVFDLSISMVSVISRPVSNRDYKIDNLSFEGIAGSINSNPEVAFWSKYFCLLTGSEYQFKISDRITEAISYNYNYGKLKSNNGLPFQNAKHTIGLKIYF
ncbi:MAG: hypothetical protein EPN88_12225 [Bacteroidetes bacterium]|nr:MAG: hypothetical protein EPN88_12225 [Bacteroidota bacterium]